MPHAPIAVPSPVIGGAAPSPVPPSEPASGGPPIPAPPATLLVDPPRAVAPPTFAVPPPPEDPPPPPTAPPPSTLASVAWPRDLCPPRLSSSRPPVVHAQAASAPDQARVRTRRESTLPKD